MATANGANARLAMRAPLRLYLKKGYRATIESAIEWMSAEAKPFYFHMSTDAETRQ
jgi:hypothetical protein